MSDTPPNDHAVERAILGAVLLNAEARDRAVAAGVNDLSFYRQGHRLIWNAMRRVEQVDLVTVAHELGPALEQIGGYTYLAGLAGAVPSVSHASSYFRQARELERLRRVLEACRVAQERILDLGGDDTCESISAGLLADVEQAGQASAHGRWVRGSELAKQVRADIDDRYENRGKLRGLTTGLRDLDQILLGIESEDLVIVAARPGMGKSAFALNVMHHVTQRLGKAAAYVSLEMSAVGLGLRSVASTGRVGLGRIRTGQIRDDDWPEIERALHSIEHERLFVSDAPIANAATLRSICKEALRIDPGLELIILDYLQLMSGDEKKDRRVAVDEISRSLKLMAKELSVPVMALSQLNRGVEQRVDKRPLMSDLRESGAIEQDADSIVFLYRDEVYNPETEDQGIAEAIVRKARNGELGTARLGWRGEFTRFENLAREDRYSGSAT